MANNNILDNIRYYQLIDLLLVMLEGTTIIEDISSYFYFVCDSLQSLLGEGSDYYRCS